jgi:sulfite exporter TauE/SafE
MCGPLACVDLSPAPLASAQRSPPSPRSIDRERDPRARRRAAVAWQAGRIATYTATGTLLGALGHAGLALARAPLARALPWVMVVGLVLSAAEVGRHLPALPGLSRVARAFSAWGARTSIVARAALRGAATPFLPCGLLYGAFVVAVGTGSALAGAAVMLAFALGALPALALVQIGAPRLAARGGAGALVRRAIPLAAAALVAWRAIGALGAGAPRCH